MGLRPIVLVGVVICAVVPRAVWAQASAPSTSGSASDDLGTALAYVAAYGTRSADDIADFYAEGIVWEDPPGGLRFEGKEAIHDHLRQIFSGPASVWDPIVTEAWESGGGFVVVQAELRWSSRARDGRAAYNGIMPLVVLLRIEDGMVTLHQEYANPACVVFQQRVQARGPIPFSMVPRCTNRATDSS